MAIATCSAAACRSARTTPRTDPEPSHRRRSGSGRAALAAACAAALLLTGCVEALFFHPNDRAYREPEKLGLTSVDVTFGAEDRSPLDGWWLPADPAAGPPLCTVVHAHGNAANISRHLEAVAWLPPLGVNVLMFDYRGFGVSLGKPSLDGVVADTVAAVHTALKQPGATPGRLVVFGQSLGGATAIRAVDELGPGQVQGLIVDSGFARYRDVAHHVAQEIKVLKLMAGLVLDTLPGDEDDPIAAIARLQVPVWIIHGDADRIVPFEQGQRLYDAARQPKTWVPVAGAQHLHAMQRPEVREVVMKALREVCRPTDMAGTHQRDASAAGAAGADANR